GLGAGGRLPFAVRHGLLDPGVDVPAVVDEENALVVVPLGHVEVEGVLVEVEDGARRVAVQSRDQVVRAPLQRQVRDLDLDLELGLGRYADRLHEGVGAEAVQTVVESVGIPTEPELEIKDRMSTRLNS